MKNKNIQINGTTRFCFLFGRDLTHSPSPAFYNKIYSENGINCVYLALSLNQREQFISCFSELSNTPNFMGGNVTMPFKSDVLNLSLVQHSETVLSCQAANTLFLNSQKQWCSENTDVIGVQESIKYLNSQKQKYSTIILGGGGAASSAFYALHQDDLCDEIFCFIRSPSNAQAFTSYYKNNKIKLFNLDDCDRVVFNEQSLIILINTLPLESSFQDNLYAINFINKLKYKNFCYFDMIYTNTKSIQLAKAQNIFCINGLLMFEEQAKASFKYMEHCLTSFS